MACTHFLDLAIAALSVTAALVCFHHLGIQMVADQLYSLILTGIIGSRDRSAPLCADWVSVGRTVADPRWK